VEGIWFYLANFASNNNIRIIVLSVSIITDTTYRIKTIKTTGRYAKPTKRFILLTIQECPDNGLTVN